MILINILLFIIIFVPKITIINISGVSTGIRLEDILTLVASICVFMNMLKNKKRYPETMNKLVPLFIIFIILGFITCIYSSALGYVSFYKSLIFLLRKVEYFIFIFLGYIYSKKVNIDRLFKSAVFFHLIISSLQLMNVLGTFKDGAYMSSLAQGRVTSIFNGSYEFGAFLLLLLPYFINNLLENSKNKIWNFVYLIILFFLIIISESRSTLFLGMFIIMLFLIKKNYLKYKKVIGRIIILAMISIPVLLLFFEKYLNRFSTISFSGFSYIVNYSWVNRNFNSYLTYNNWFGSAPDGMQLISLLGYDTSFYMRFSHWVQLIDGLNNSLINWIIGIGPSIFGTAADGNYMRLLVEHGILGFVIWLLILNELSIIFKKSKNYNYFYFSFISVVLGSIFIDLFEAARVMPIIWFFAGYALSNEGVKNEKDN